MHTVLEKSCAHYSSNNMELAFGNNTRITIFVVNYDTVLRQAPTPTLIH